MGAGGGTSTLPSPPPRESLRKMQCSSLMKCPLRTMSCRLSASSLPTLLKNRGAAGQLGQQSPSIPSLLAHSCGQPPRDAQLFLLMFLNTRLYVLWEYTHGEVRVVKGPPV